MTIFFNCFSKNLSIRHSLADWCQVNYFQPFVQISLTLVANFIFGPMRLLPNPHGPGEKPLHPHYPALHILRNLL